MALPIGGMSNFPILESDRLQLRELVQADAPALLSIHGDREAMRWFGTDPLTDLQQAERLVETFASWRHLPNPGLRWGIERKADGALIGTCGLFKWNRGWRSCTLGYELASSSWGEGFMRESLTTVIDWGFDSMGLNRIEAQIHPQNAASLGLARRLGFVEEGLLRQAGYWLDEYHDLIQFSLLRREWRDQGSSP